MAVSEKLKDDSAQDKYHPAKLYPDLDTLGIYSLSTVPPSSTSTAIASSPLFGTKVTRGNPNVIKLDASHV
jgi:hypothetical protein